MKNIITLLVTCAILTTTLFHACLEPPNYPNEPVISFLSVNKTSVLQANLGADTLAITFSFTDGDGDLTYPANSGQDKVDLFYTPSIGGDSLLTISTPLLNIPSQGASNGISGEITFFLYNQGICCDVEDYPLATPCSPLTYPEGATNTVYYNIYIKDRAGNLSNVIRTDDITIVCR